MQRILIIIFVVVIYSVSSLERFVDFGLIKKASAPRFLESGILFTLRPGTGQDVFLRTDLDNWEKNHYFKESLYGVQYAFVPYKRGHKVMQYKINADGFWIEDPYNPQTNEDIFGVVINRLSIPASIDYYSRMPIVEKTDSSIKKVTFKYYNPLANEVNFVSSIDNWNSFTNSMARDPAMDGYWTIDMYFKNGSYLYFFLVDGVKVIDIENPSNAFIDRYNEVSVLNVVK